VSTIMVVIIVVIHWMIYVICYRRGSTSTAYIAKTGLWVELHWNLFAGVVGGVQRMVWQGRSTSEVSILGCKGCHGELVNDQFFHVDPCRKGYQKLLRPFFHIVLQNYELDFLKISSSLSVIKSLSSIMLLCQKQPSL